MILADSASDVDSDINCQETIPVSNDGFESAQPLRVPVILGGYVNQPGRGPSGNSFSSGDRVDYFFLTLKGDETIRIALPDQALEYGADLALSLYASQDTADPVGGIDHVGQTATLAAPAQGGDFYIKVLALAGASSYRLIVSRPDAAPLQAATAETADRVPGQILVRFDSGTFRALEASPHAGIPGLEVLEKQAGGWMRLKLADPQAAFRRLGIRPGHREVRAAPGNREHGNLKRDTLRVIQALKQQPGVLWAEPNYIRRPLLEPNDPLFDLQWHYRLINLPQAWDLAAGSDQVIVAVLDSGVLPDHPDLAGMLVPGYDFISDASGSGDGDGIDPDASDPGDDPNGNSSFHGTHIAGSIAAATNNNLGVAGVGGGARVMPVRVLGLNGGTEADIANAVRWAAGLEVRDSSNAIVPPPERPAGIINMSFGSTAPLTSTLQTALAEARAAGAILIAAAGNEASATRVYPAASPDVLSVAAVDINGQRANYSSFGFIDLAAPGGDVSVDQNQDGYADGILSTAGTDADGPPPEPIYAYFQGTSMASAHAAGVTALMKALRADMTPDDFNAYLAGQEITVDLSDVASYGYGLIDAQLAVAAVSRDPAALLAVSPPALHLDAEQSTATVSVRQVGAGDLLLDTPVTDVDWLSVAYLDNQQDRLGRYQVDVNRARLPAEGGFQTGTVTFASSANTIRVAVTVQVLPDPNADGGLQFILLIDADNTETRYERIATAANGRYSFSFDGIPAGSYYLVSGSDIDNDGFVLRQGEAGGGYPSVAALQEITLQGDLPGIQFTTGFSQLPFLQPQSAGEGFAVR
jgi:serine protease